MNDAYIMWMSVLLAVSLVANIACWLEKEDYKNELRRMKDRESKFLNTK